jgi:hypothetical protein
VIRCSAIKVSRSRCKGVTMESTAEGHIVAAIVDYAALRTLAAHLVSGGAGANVAAEVPKTCGRPVVALASEQRPYECFVPAVTIPLSGSRDPPLDKGAVGRQQTPNSDPLPE